MELICLPYAGATAAVYKKWEKHFDGKIRVRPLELPGRGSKFLEPRLSSMEELTEHVYEELTGKMGAAGYALLGHSLGAALAYRLSLRLEREGRTPPLHLFLSGLLPPHMPRPYRIDHAQPDSSLIQQLSELGGVPQEILERPDMLQLVLPTVRSDLQAHNTSGEQALPAAAISSPISVLSGRHDPLTAGDMGGWSDYTRGECRYYTFKGGHFFIHEYEQQVAAVIRTALLAEAAR